MTVKNGDFFKRAKKKLEGLRAERSDFIGWELIEKTSRSLQKLYAGKGGNALVPHQEREVDETSWRLAVYMSLEEEDVMGLGSSDMLPFLELEGQILKAMELAKNSRNRAWKLPEKPAAAYPEVLTYDPLIKNNPEHVIESIEKEARDVLEKMGDIHVNSAELYVNFSGILRETHTGIRTFKEKSDIYLEAAMERAGCINDKEVHEKAESVTRADLKVTEFLNECADQVRSLGASEEPDTSESAMIEVRQDVIASLLNSLTDQLAGAFEYMKYPFLREGDRIFSGEKAAGSDKLDLVLDPFIPGMTLSSGYTAEGLVAEKGRLIRGDVVEARIMDNRYGQYLSRPSSGICGNLTVPPGRMSYRDFCRTAPSCLEIVKFSSLLVDSRKLTWSSEIKLGRQHRPDGSVSLVKGGVVSGRLPENLADFIFSLETARVNSPGNEYNGPLGYMGPARMLIRRGVSIAGK